MARSMKWRRVTLLTPMSQAMLRPGADVYPALIMPTNRTAAGRIDRVVRSRAA